MNYQNTFLITGGFGFLGSYLVPILIERINNSRILVVCRAKKKTSWEGSPKVQLFYGDLKDRKLWASLPRTITHIFHLAAIIPWKREDQNKALIVQDNLMPLAHLIEYSQAWPDLQQVIFSSSISVYAKIRLLLNEDSLKRPETIYGASKLAGEQLLLCLKSKEVRVASLRYSSLYGYGQYQGTVLPAMVNRAIHKKEILVYGDGKRTQDFLHVKDAANANLLAFEKQAQGIFNIGSGIPITMEALAQTISRIFTNNEAKIIYLPQKEDLDPGFMVDISKVKQELNYQPSFQIEDGLQKLKKEMGMQ